MSLLSLAILALCRLCDCKDDEFVDLIEQFVEYHKNIAESLESILENYLYSAMDRKENKILLLRNNYFQIDSVPNIDFVSRLNLPISLKSFIA